MNKLIILDRDGVINFDSDDYIKTADEWQPIPGSLEAIADLCNAGFTVAVATNQSGLGRGLFDQDTLDTIHAKMHHLVSEAGGELAGVFYCPHSPDDLCDCRKPKSGLIKQIAADLDHSVKGAYLIGDSLRDLQAGQSEQCIPLLVKTGKGERTIAQGEGLDNISIFDDLAAAVKFILDNNS